MRSFLAHVKVHSPHREVIRHALFGHEQVDVPEHAIAPAERQPDLNDSCSVIFLRIVYISRRWAEEFLRPFAVDKDEETIEAENVGESDCRMPRKCADNVADVLVDTAERSVELLFL